MIGSQYGEDKIISRFFDTGYFVDVGAADGIDNSNTYNLILHGWKGILIEPNKKLYEYLCNQWKHREDIKIFNIAITNTECPVESIFYTSGQVSTLSKRWMNECKREYRAKYKTEYINCCKLTMLLNEFKAPRHIDFLTIDAEGSDLEVLLSIDFNKYSFSLICVEAHYNYNEIDMLLKSNNYEPYKKTSGNYFYKMIGK